MRIAIMQPYFIPYAGYFRLLSETDLFVIYDCVQFPRRGWVHRNKLPKSDGKQDWLTLNLKKTPQETLIKDLEFAQDAQKLWDEQCNQFGLLSSSKKHPLKDFIKKIDGTPLEYIVGSLKTTCECLNIKWNVEYSSNLKLPDNIRGQDRIIAIAKHFGAKEYLNAPGGKELYDKGAFERKGISLEFLGDYSDYRSILELLLTEETKKIAARIRSTY